MRRLNRAVAGFHTTDDDLRTLARRAHELADALEAGGRRSKEHDVAGFLPAVEAPVGSPVRIGDAFEFDPFSAGGGRLHPASIGYAMVRDGETSVAATATVDGMFQGPPGRVHGGVVALIVDELMGAVIRVSGVRAYTARLTVNLRTAAPIETELRFRAWLDGIDGRKHTIRAQGTSADGPFLDAEALFVAVPTS